MTPPQRPFWLDRDRDPCFAVHHPADPTATARVPILILPPFGWHDVASYRSRRTWAMHLASNGHPALRIDLPGTGDSGGSAASADLPKAWVDAVGQAARWLADAAEAPAVTVIGLGLGGLIAAQAIAADAPIDGLVTWAVAAEGREEVRRQRAFARLQTARYSLTEPEPVVLADGWLEVNGFILSAETIAALAPLRVPGPSIGRLRRALVLDADGIAAPASLVAGLRAAGVEVETAAGPGWSAMTFHPQQDDAPTAVIAAVDRWLDDSTGTEITARSGATPAQAGSTDRRPSSVHPAEPPVEAVLRDDGVAVRETAIVRRTPGGALFGILSRSDAVRASPVAAVFLNAGAVRRIGPNRIWVEASRRWARRGVPSLRIDLEGIGDSDGDSGQYRDVGQFYAREVLADQIRIMSDELVARTGAGRIVLAGLCAGGYWAFLGADRDPRVAAAYMLNPGALEWRTDLVRRRNARRIRRLGDPAWWRRLVRGQVRVSRMRAIATAALSEGLRGRIGGGSLGVGQAGPGRPETAPAAIIERLDARGTTVAIAFSNDEVLHDELARDGFLDRIETLPNVHLETLPGRDHTLRPVIAQRAVHDLLDRALLADLARIAVATDTGAA
jgi:alpha-beta hydrolase superfamily lysophospholipase